MDNVYVVSYLLDQEPVIATFDNIEAANKYFEYKSKTHKCYLDKCPVYQKFLNKKVSGV